MKYYEKDGVILPSSKIVCAKEFEGKTYSSYNPSEEQILSAGWAEISPDKKYKLRITELIHARYTVDDEIAILRQRDTKQEEFAAYDAFAEECKCAARIEIYGGES